MKLLPRRLLIASLMSSSLLLSLNINAAGFALQEQSVSGLGVSFASGATAQEDNSSMVYNPATLVYYNDAPQVTSGLHIIAPEAEFRNTGTVSGYVEGFSPGVPTQGNNSTSDDPAFIPNFYASYPINENLVAGLGISTPFGLASEYDDGWVGRYIALKSELETVQLNLAGGYKVNEKISIGAGFSILRAEAVLSNAINFGLALGLPDSLGTTKYDGKINLEGDDIGYGFNFGFLVNLSEKTQLGFQYRSKIDLTLSGYADFTVGVLENAPVGATTLGNLYADQGGQVDLELPTTVNVSVRHDISDKWALMADVLYTKWSSFEKLVIEFGNGILPDTVIDEGWEDVYRYSVGTTYRLNSNVVLRAGIAFDESPVPNNSLRSPRIPDEDRTWLSVGLGWNYSDHLVFDFAYTHILVDDPVVDNSVHTTGEYLRGTIDATVNIVSIGGTYTF